MSSLYLLLLAAVLTTIAANPRTASRVKRQVPGGTQEDDPTKPEYYDLAVESFEQYKDEHPAETANIHVKNIKPYKATVQVVAGTIKNVYYTVCLCNCESLNCHAKIFEQKWQNYKEITVSCN